MTEQECLDKMIPPAGNRPSKPYRGGVIQVWVTSACDKACFGCTQGSNLAGLPGFITVGQFEQACASLKGYFGVVGMFGGNPAIHPRFRELCAVMRRHVPTNQRGIWSNNPLTIENARIMRDTFDPSISNLNVHLDQKAYGLFKDGWPECGPVGLLTDSRHSPPFVAMKDVIFKSCPNCNDGPDESKFTGGLNECLTCRGRGVVPDESKIWELISDCDINKHWSAMIGVFRGQLRAWFCEVAGAQAMLHQDEPDYPDTGIPLDAESQRRRDESGYIPHWWKMPMEFFRYQVRKHCFDCGVPLRGYGELAQSVDSAAIEQTSVTHSNVYRPKRRGRLVEMVNSLTQLEVGKLKKITDYLGNAKR